MHNNVNTESILFGWTTLYGIIFICFSANTAATVAGLMWFLSYFPYMLTQNNYDDLDLTTKMLLCLGSNSAVAMGFQTMILFEGMGDGKLNLFMLII